MTLQHTLGTRAPLDRVFNRGPYPMGGDGDTLWNSQVARHDATHDGVMIGPPFRFIADLSDLGQSRGQLMPGQSGQIGSPHYADGIGPWLRGDYHPMVQRRERVHPRPVAPRWRFWCASHAVVGAGGALSAPQVPLITPRAHRRCR